MPDHTFDRRDFLRIGAAAGAAAAGLVQADLASQPRQGVALEDAGIAELQRRMAAGEITAYALTQQYLERIERLDRSGPRLNCVLDVNPDALQLADLLDAERRAGRVRGPLHGIPVLVKENIATADRMPTTAGSLALEGSRPPSDAHLVARLRTAGAILLGKSNLSEWANFRSTKSTSGWSGRGGLCRNPHALDRNTSGSSSGSGGAAAASLAAATIGTETDGSIVSPSTSCGVVGLKPTVGLVSRKGIVPIAHSQDTAGPMTRSVADAAVMLTAMAGSDPDDPATRRADAQRARDYTTYLREDGLAGLRIGVVRERLMGYSVHADRVAEEAIAALRELGATIVDPVKPPAALGGDLPNAEFEVLLYEFKADLEAYFAWLGHTTPVKRLEDVIAFNQRYQERELPYFGQEIFTMAAEKGPLTTPAYRTALTTCRRLARTEGIDGMMTRHRLDALFAPTGGPAWLTDLVNGDSYPGGSSTLAAIAGYPHVTVPAGWAFGLPIGVSFFGRAWSEPVLIRIAYAFERATAARRAPRFAPAADL